MAEAKTIQEKNSKMYFKGALVGGVSGLAIGILIGRSKLILSIVGLLIGGYIGYRFSDIKEKTKTATKEFKNIK